MNKVVAYKKEGSGSGQASGLPVLWPPGTRGKLIPYLLLAVPFYYTTVQCMYICVLIKRNILILG